MLSQMQRRELELAGHDLIDAIDSSWDTFQVLLQLWDRSKLGFIGQELQPDPSSTLMAVQAQALGIKTLAKWLKELGGEVGIKYYNIGQARLDALQRELDARGLVLPDQK